MNLLLALSPKMGLFYACCVVLVVVPVVFILNSVYQDGVFGRLGLGGVAFSAATFLMEMLGGTQYEMLPQTVLMVAAFTLFLVWHLWRFHRRVLHKRSLLQDAKRVPDGCPVIEAHMRGVDAKCEVADRTLAMQAPYKLERKEPQ